ncbi:hypothetical protein D3C79_879540 [compost metagenome]
MSQPPIDGPAAWATLLDRLNKAMPSGILLAGSSVMISCIDSGISTAPEAPWMTRMAIIACRLGARAQLTELSRNTTEPTNITRRRENTCTSQAVSGIMVISATR